MERELKLLDAKGKNILFAFLSFFLLFVTNSMITSIFIIECLITYVACYVVEYETAYYNEWNGWLVKPRIRGIYVWKPRLICPKSLWIITLFFACTLLWCFWTLLAGFLYGVIFNRAIPYPALTSMTAFLYSQQSFQLMGTFATLEKWSLDRWYQHL